MAYHGGTCHSTCSSSITDREGAFYINVLFVFLFLIIIVIPMNRCCWDLKDVTLGMNVLVDYLNIYNNGFWLATLPQVILRRTSQEAKKIWLETLTLGWHGLLPWVASRIKVSAAPSIPTKNHNYGDFTPFQAPQSPSPSALGWEVSFDGEWCMFLDIFINSFAWRWFRWHSLVVTGKLTKAVITVTSVTFTSCEQVQP